MNTFIPLGGYYSFGSLSLSPFIHLSLPIFFLSSPSFLPPPPSLRPSLPIPSLPSPSLLPLSLSPPLFPPSLLQAKPRPPSTVEKLLQVHGLQHFTELLIANGYDDIHFITEISEDELQEIGITQASDRSKVRHSHPTGRLHSAV